MVAMSTESGIMLGKCHIMKCHNMMGNECTLLVSAGHLCDVQASFQKSKICAHFWSFFVIHVMAQIWMSQNT